MTIKEEINRVRNAVLANPDCSPGEAATHLNELAALIGNIAEELADRQMAYNRVLHSAYEMEETSNRAKILAGISPEYQAMIEAKAMRDTAVELMRALKYFIRVKEDEWEASRSL